MTLTTLPLARVYDRRMATDYAMHGKKKPDGNPAAPIASGSSRTEIKRQYDGSGCRRVHVVMVPGFGGFDALGQLRYYPRTTLAAKEWRKKRREQPGGHDPGRLVLHYFDNLPTAGVNTRAHRLLRYLLDREHRNDFNDDDVIVLVGHSTGGLDIRRLLQILLPVRTKGSAKTSKTVHKRLIDEDAAKLRAKIKRVVFLSVPQRGTNIANWVRGMEPWPISLVAVLREAVDWLDFRPIEAVEAGFIHKAVVPVRACVGRSLSRWAPDIYSAILDIFTENALRISRDPIEAADGREALAALSSYLNQSDGDFFAIDDLAAADPTPAPHRNLLFRFVRALTSRTRRIAHRDTTEVARASEEDRAEELRAWKDNQIQTLSFATFANPGVCPGAVRDETEPRRWSALLGWIPRPRSKTDGTYRFVYRACQWGPFAEHGRPALESNAPDRSGEGTLFPGSGTRDEHGYVPFHDLIDNDNFVRSWENDGIVNTASMLWPNGAETLLVQGDHADIIGHFEAMPVKGPPSGRKYDAYDIFGSDSGFTQARFDAIWARIFDFSLDALAVEPVGAVA